jgi:hypothetical protein
LGIIYIIVRFESRLEKGRDFFMKSNQQQAPNQSLFE